MKLKTHIAAVLLALLLTPLAAFLGLPRYISMRLEEHFPLLRGGFSYVIAGLFFFALPFVASAVATAALVISIRVYSKAAFAIVVPLAPILFGLFQTAAVQGGKALGIHVFNSTFEVVAAVICGALFGISFSIVAFGLMRVAAQPDSA